MKTIGLIGGMSWESTSEYYRLLNETVKARLGGLHSAKCILYSVDFAEVEVFQRAARWEEAAKHLAAVAQCVEKGGADFVVLCTNTMHKLADAIQEQLRIPLLHIADATARKVQETGVRQVGLLGTRFTMEEDFYRGRLERRFGLSVLVPSTEEREDVHRIIYEELCLGVVRQESAARMARVMDHLVQAGAEGIILGCTELTLLIRPEASRLPLFDTTRIHALAAVEYALGSQPLTLNG